MDQLDIIEKGGYTAERFISIHTQAEPDFAMHLAVARRGAWIEYDGIGGWGEDADYIANIHRVLDAGFGDRLMLSQDRGWFDPAQPGGGTPKPYTYLMRGLPAEAPRQRCRRGDYRHADPGQSRSAPSPGKPLAPGVALVYGRPAIRHPRQPIPFAAPASR